MVLLGFYYDFYNISYIVWFKVVFGLLEFFNLFKFFSMVENEKFWFEFVLDWFLVRKIWKLVWFFYIYFFIVLNVLVVICGMYDLVK